MHLHKIGVVTPTYNRAKLLSRALDSVIAQSYVNWEICVVDDCSPDETPVMMQQYISNPKIHYIRLEKNSGPGTARNRALDYLINEKGCTYITFLDDDDYMTKDAFNVANTVINDNPDHKWFVSHRIHEDGSRISQFKTDIPVSYFDCFTGAGGVQGDAVQFISSELIDNIRFTENVYGREWHFSIQLSKKADMYLYDFDSAVTEYLEDGLSLSSPKQSKEENKRIRKIEKELLLKLGYTYEYIEMLKAKNLFLQSLKTDNPYKVFKKLWRYLRLKVRSLIASVKVMLKVYS